MANQFHFEPNSRSIQERLQDTMANAIVGKVYYTRCTPEEIAREADRLNLLIEAHTAVPLSSNPLFGESGKYVGSYWRVVV